jgi:aminoglycoside N3'-acetyltransferase
MNKKINKEIKFFLFKNLKKIEVKKGDSLYLAINLNLFYFPFLKKLNFKNKEEAVNLFINLLKNYIGKKGTLICSSFTFDFIKKRFFNKYKTSPNLGFFEKVFVFKKGVHRSGHPINSIASWGKNSKFLTENHGPYSFGYNSPFEKFNKLKVKFLNIGITYGKTCTYVHHLEHLNGINHRFYKAVKGFVFHNKKFIKKVFFFLALFKDVNLKKKEFLIEEELRRKKLIKENISNGVYFSKINSSDVFEEGLKLLQKNTCAFIKKKYTINFVENNLKKKINKKNIFFKLNEAKN